MLTIKQYQINLNFLNFYCGVPDGFYGTKTMRGIKQFQSTYGLLADGIYGNITNSTLVAVIKDIQIKLKCSMIDGIVGNETYTKCKEFQRANGLDPDGICGTKTIAKLYNKNSYSWDNVEHFKKSEFACKCGCGYDDIDIKLVKILEDIRSHFGDRPLIITSGCRCNKHNAEVGGVQGSYHTQGKATDIYIQGISTQDLLNYCNQLVNQGILRYTYTNNKNMTGAIHIDIGGK